MIISKENRRTIYASLFKEGVMVAPKNFEVKHPELDLPNLEVVKAMQSLTSKGYVHTQFSWQWYFYTLTDEGLEYLREFLHLPSEIVPATHKRPARPQRAAVGGREGGAYRAPRGDRAEGGDREYRRRDAGDKKDGAPSGEYRPRFAGVGRGAPRE
ncbi:putative 40S ribosomal protein S10 [Violaceomyces palustris]|uniref:40S ribosomal protein S10 n=1 Tax=Violaceomyces palustris TaxID=1673888 RepID=A0ACD0NXD6_9BASI|nr:putative 40S ribosomal protein S10 [Violaceomyces palustris]